MTSAPIILVPGFWLGAWAWDEVAAALRDDGQRVTALTLPGLESVETDRSKIALSDHVEAICDAVVAAGVPVVLVVHSGAGAPGYAVTDLVPERVAAAVYVDSGPAKGAFDAGFTGVEQPLGAWDELSQSLDGISAGQLAEFRRRAVPQPGATVREAHEFTNDARLDVPTTVVCTSVPAEQIQAWVSAGVPFVSGLAELHTVAYVDLPTSHWPMFSRPRELAALISDVARRAGERSGSPIDQ
jgi:pimeloyl-ACP methyl ester carboxylesterase